MLEVEVDGTSEEVWRAIATGPGISSWYVPRDPDEREGGHASFGPGPEMQIPEPVAVWEPPRRIGFTGYGPGPTLAFGWLVEALDGSCEVRLVNTGFGSGEEPCQPPSRRPPACAEATPIGYGRRVANDESNGPAFPLRDWLGFTIESGDGESRAWLDVDARHINPHGTVHGAVLYALVDTAMGGATMSVLPDGNWCATLDIHTRYLAPCFGGRITAVATVRRAGKRVVHLDGVVTGEDGTEYLAASGIFAVIPAAG